MRMNSFKKLLIQFKNVTQVWKEEDEFILFLFSFLNI